jgi:uncharacterized membrane protein/uncharacterized protein YrrD
MTQSREIAIGATVVCSDGEFGKLTDVIVNPVRRRLTHVVVQERGGAARSLVVPVEQIGDFEASRQTVRLRCTLAEAAKLPEFYATHYVPSTAPEAQPTIQAWERDMTLAAGYGAYYSPYVAWEGDDVPVTEEQVPPGELSFHRGTSVAAKDGGDVGSVEEFVIDSRDDTITHFVVRLGHLLGAREVALPVSTVASATSETVTLKLSREELERLPAIPVRRHYQWASGSTGEVELVALVFPTPERAQQALDAAKERVSAGRLSQIDAAVLTKSAAGKVSYREEHDVSGGRGAALGAIVGGVTGLLAGPVGVAIGAAAGGAVGGATGRWHDTGVPDRYLEDLGRALQPGSSALVVLVHPASVDALIQATERLGGTVLRQLLTDDMIARLTKAPLAEPRESAAGAAPERSG